MYVCMYVCTGDRIGSDWIGLKWILFFVHVPICLRSTAYTSACTFYLCCLCRSTRGCIYIYISYLRYWLMRCILHTYITYIMYVGIVICVLPTYMCTDAVSCSLAWVSLLDVEAMCCCCQCPDFRVSCALNGKVLSVGTCITADMYLICTGIEHSA